MRGQISDTEPADGFDIGMVFEIAAEDDAVLLGNVGTGDLGKSVGIDDDAWMLDHGERRLQRAPARYQSAGAILTLQVAVGRREASRGPGGRPTSSTRVGFGEVAFDVVQIEDERVAMPAQQGRVTGAPKMLDHAQLELAITKASGELVFVAGIAVEQGRNAAQQAASELRQEFGRRGFSNAGGGSKPSDLD